MEPELQNAMEPEPFSAIGANYAGASYSYLFKQHHRFEWFMFTTLMKSALDGLVGIIVGMEHPACEHPVRIREPGMVTCDSMVHWLGMVQRKRNAPRMVAMILPRAPVVAP